MTDCLIKVTTALAVVAVAGVAAIISYQHASGDLRDRYPGVAWRQIRAFRRTG